jgi:hypothetical protein
MRVGPAHRGAFVSDDFSGDNIGGTARLKRCRAVVPQTMKTKSAAPYGIGTYARAVEFLGVRVPSSALVKDSRAIGYPKIGSQEELHCQNTASKIWSQKAAWGVSRAAWDELLTDLCPAAERR